MPQFYRSTVSWETNNFDFHLLIPARMRILFKNKCSYFSFELILHLQVQKLKMSHQLGFNLKLHPTPKNQTLSSERYPLP